MKKTLVSILFLVFLARGLFAISEKDSLMRCLKTYPEDSAAKLYNELFLNFIYTSIDTALIYSNNALKLAEKYENHKEIMFAYDGLGVCYYNKGKLDSALSYWQKALVIAQQLNVPKNIAYFLNEIGVAYKTKGEYKTAIKNYQQSYDINEKLGNKLQMGLALANIGNIYFTFGIDLDKSLDYYNRALDLFEKSGRKRYEAMVLNSISSIYENKKDYNQALSYLRRSLTISEQEKEVMSIAQAHANMGNIYLASGNFKLALEYNLKSLSVFKKLGRSIDIAQTYGNIGKIFYKMGDYPSALSYIRQSLEIKAQMKNKKEILDSYQFISKVYSAMGDYKSAYENFQQYSILKDSTMGEDYMKQMQEMEAKYESDKKDGEIKIQKAEISKKETEAKRKNFILYSFAIFLVVILFFSFLLYKQFTEKKRANVLLAEQNDEIKHQRDQIYQQKKEITDSIHYASRIQRAVLPPERLLSDNGFEHFILFKPRDIVSGDFYWMNQREDKIIVAAADCTGHGVPGAFMSMLGMAFLNEIVSKGEFENAAHILNQLRSQIIKSLHQTGKMEDTKDGMDMSLCIFEKNSNKMHFAGAFNSLYLIRNGELLESSADRMPIGIHDKMNESFTNHIVELTKGDTLYILSDGYIDQFGGENGKKFMSKRFKQMLVDLQAKNMEAQKNVLDQTLTQWRGEYDQVDDVMVIGIRV